MGTPTIVILILVNVKSKLSLIAPLRNKLFHVQNLHIYKDSINNVFYGINKLKYKINVADSINKMLTSVWPAAYESQWQVDPITTNQRTTRTLDFWVVSVYISKLSLAGLLATS